MMSEIKRVHYYDHQYLREQDFTDEQTYHTNMRRRHNRSLHTSGIIHGFEITISDDKSEIQVSAGMAMDINGKEIVLESSENHIIEIENNENGFRYISIQYHQEQTDPPPDDFEITAADNTRWTESALINIEKEIPEDTGIKIILGKISIEAGKIKEIDISECRYSGACGEGHFSKVGIGTSGSNNTLTVFGTGETGKKLDSEKWQSRIGTADRGRLLLGTCNDQPAIQGDGEGTNNNLFLNPLTGNVGIGTLNPNNTLTVFGTGETGKKLDSEKWQSRIGTADKGRLLLGTCNDQPAIQGDGQGTDNNLLLNPLTGNVGINITNPAGKFDVRATSDMSTTGLNFDGANDFELVPDNPSLRIKNYTVELWLKTNGKPNESYKGIIGKPGRNFHSWLHNNGYIHHRFHTSISTNAGAPDTPQGSITWSEWNHVAITNDGKRAKTYINGELRADGKVDGSLIADSNELIVGKNIDGNPRNWFNGKLKNIRIWNKARSASEIKKLFDGTESTLVGNEAGLVLYWPLQGTENAPHDLTSNSNHSVRWLGLNVAENGNVGIGTLSPRSKLTVSGGAICPAPGNSASAGIMFPKDPFGGSGDAAWIRYYSRGGEATTFEIGTANDSNDHLALMASGNVGVGINDPKAKLDVKGTIKSTMWKVTQVFSSQKGPLLKEGKFTSGGGTLLIFASGTGFQKGRRGSIGMEIRVDNVRKGYAKSYTNEWNSHKAFSANPLVVTRIKAGNHTIRLVSWNGTETDGNDYFNVTVLELPF